METSLLSAVAALVIASSAQAQNIDTTGNTNQIVYPFGSPDTATYGQTFTAGASDTLNSFSLFLNGTGSSLTFRGYLAEWNGSTATNLLYTSGDQTISSAAQYQEFAFAPNVELTAGAQYVAFLSISDLPAQVSGTYTMPYSSLTDALPGGGFVFQNNGQNFGQLFGTVWSSFGSNDVAFKASFGAVPEPATWALMILGFGVVGGAMRRRQSATAKVHFA